MQPKKTIRIQLEIHCKNLNSRVLASLKYLNDTSNPFVMPSPSFSPESRRNSIMQLKMHNIVYWTTLTVNFASHERTEWIKEILYHQIRWYTVTCSQLSVASITEMSYCWKAVQSQPANMQWIILSLRVFPSIWNTKCSNGILLATGLLRILIVFIHLLYVSMHTIAIISRAHYQEAQLMCTNQHNLG